MQKSPLSCSARRATCAPSLPRHARPQEWAAGLKRSFSHIDYLINNSGVGSWNDLDEVTPEELLLLFQTNAMGPLLVTQALQKQGLLGRPGGPSVIANMTSKVTRQMLGAAGFQAASISEGRRCSACPSI